MVGIIMIEITIIGIVFIEVMILEVTTMRIIIIEVTTVEMTTSRFSKLQKNHYMDYFRATVYNNFTLARKSKHLRNLGQDLTCTTDSLKILVTNSIHGNEIIESYASSSLFPMKSVGIRDRGEANQEVYGGRLQMRLALPR